ncbi:MAG: tetratricopeptide repeat protein [Candidatus Eremiobacteraeota bacterium]|nr:tetratricopeptide repeat protein [Candidatus Eremiobacteraeota bacterium]
MKNRNKSLAFSLRQLILFAMIFFVLSGVVSAGKTDIIDENVEKAVLSQDWEKVYDILKDKYIKSKKPSSARVLLTIACLETDRDTEGWKLLCNLKKEDNEQWKKWVETIVSKYPDNPVSHFLLGSAYSRSGDYKKAIEELDLAIKLDQKFAAAYVRRGRTYMLLNKRDKAMADYNKALEIKPKSYKAYIYLGDAFTSEKDYDKAIEQYSKAIKIKPNKSLAIINRAYTYLHQDEYDPAIKDFTRAIKITPEFAGVYYGRGIAYKNKKEYKRALKDLTRSIELKPFASAYFERGNLYVSLKKYDEAKKDFNMAIKKDLGGEKGFIGRKAKKALVELKK